MYAFERKKFHVPHPSPSLCCLGSVSKRTDGVPSNTRQEALAGFLQNRWRNELLEFAGFSCRTFFLLAFVLGWISEECLFFIILFILFHFMNSKNFKVNFWFSRLLIIVAKLNPKIPWVDRWGKITCSLLINHKPCSGNILYYVFQNYVIHFRSKPGILKSRYMYIGRIIHFK